MVSWAGPEPAPVWLDTAREYTERWHHQQHIRDAVRRAGLTEPRYLQPVLATFVRALPFAFRGIEAPTGTAIRLVVAGAAGGSWTLRRKASEWSLRVDNGEPSAATVETDQDTAWRILTKALSRGEARTRAHLSGELRLAERVLETVAIHLTWRAAILRSRG